ncbi:MAG: large repetitive protein, partial [Solirubrobacteraceae bacterium]|nr:large repetitive protein [Solirubrobacteraceae bacterium]
QSLTATVAHFTDADPNGAAGDYTATIDWGDGATSSGTVTPGVDIGFDVNGAHTYSSAGSFTVTTSVTDAGTSTTSATSTAQIAVAPVFVVVHTVGVDEITTTSARASGTVNDGGAAVSYHFEYGQSTAYGASTATATSDGSGTDQPVAATLPGLNPDTDYHVRLVADAPSGPVFGEDIAFHTAQPGTAPGLPPGLDFTWSPRADVLVAGAPFGGVQFQATPGPGVSYQWAFDSPPTSGFAADPGAAGDAPRHTFTADGAHDTDKADGAGGARRRLYTVRLRATAANGASVEVSHDLVVVPNTPPLVDFQTDGQQNVNQPTVLTPSVSDPAGPRVANHVDHIEWSFDTPTATHPAGDPSATDLICNADGSGCHVPGGGLPGPWFSQGNGHQAVVNFYQRALAVHGLPELSTLDLNALPQNAPDGSPLTGGLRALDGQGFFTVFHDLRVAYLYDNATLLQQTSFALDAGEATGARLQAGAPLSTDITSATRSTRALKRLPYTTTIKQTDNRLRLLQVLDGHQLEWRQVTLTAVDTAGVRTSVTQSVPLRAVSAPDLRAKFVDESATRTVSLGRRRVHIAPDTQTINHPMTTNDELAFDASGTQDATGKIAYYTLEVGQRQGCRAPAGHPQQQYQGLPVFNSVDPPVDGYRPGEFFGRPSAAGAGLGLAVGRSGNLAAQLANPHNILNVGFGSARGARAQTAANASSLPTLGQKLALGPVVHSCSGGANPADSFAARNVFPQVFMVRDGLAARPPYRAPISPRPIPGAKSSPLEFATTALVTSNPANLRFRIPVAGVYSVTVAAYNDAGLGAIQRTDGFRIEKPDGACEPVTGQVTLGGKKLGFSGDCAAVGGQDRSRVWTGGDLTVNGVGLRPLGGAHVFLDSRSRQLFATTASLPADLNQLSAQEINRMDQHPAAVQIVFERDPVAKFGAFDNAAAVRFIQGSQNPASNPAVFTGATYHGSPVAAAENGGANWDTLHVDFFGGTGDSRAYFRVVLPKEFSSESAPAAPTSDVMRVGHTDVPATELTTNHFATIARRHGGVGRAGAATGGGPVARAAAAGVSGTLSLDNTHLGPLTINSGTLTFDSGQGTWRGDIHDAYLEMFPAYKVSAHILIQNGALRELGGKVEGLDIPVFAGVFLNEVHFQIVTDPLTLSGGAGFTALAGALTGNLDMVIRTKPVFLRLEGRIAVASIPLARAYVQYDEANHSTVSFGGHLGVDFGPVSMNADLAGAISGQTGDFFIEGQGEVCVGICINAGALMSNVAVALCGGFHIGPLKLEAGAAYRFSPGKLEVFAGCDLDPYKPAIFRAREVRGGGTVGRISLASDVLPVAAGTREVSFRFHGNPATAGAPSITLISPTGRTYQTAPTAGDYTFAAPAPGAGGVTQIGGALIDRDPVDHVTTAIIVNPPAGNWQVQTPPAQAPISSVDIARGEHIPDNAFQGNVAHASLDAAAARVSTRAYTASISSARSRFLRTLPKLERGRLVSAQLNLPAGLTGKLKLVDVGPTSSSPIQTITLTPAGRRMTIAFAPTDEPGAHQIQAVKYQPSGPGSAALPQRAFVVGGYVAPAIPRPSAPKLRIHRGARGRLLVDVTPGTAGPLTTGATTFEIVASTAAGERIEQVIYAYRGSAGRHARRDLNRAKPLSGGRFRVTLTGISQTTSVKVYGRMQYASSIGRVSSAMLRCHACRRGQ